MARVRQRWGLLTEASWQALSDDDKTYLLAWDKWQQGQLTTLYTNILNSNENKLTPEQAIMMLLGRTGLYG